MDKQSGFNLLQAAVFEGKYNVVSKIRGLLDNFVEEMRLVTTGNNAKIFPGKTAVDILLLIESRKPSHFGIERLYNEWAKEYGRLTELQWATCHDDVEQAVELVLNEGVDINNPVSDNDCTALLQASRSSSSQFIETLIDLGADVNAQRRETPLMLAADWNNYMAASLILRHGADVNVHISNGFTPLHVSVNKSHENLVRLLLKHNANVNIQTTYGYTPLRQSFLKGNESLCRLLLEHKADVNIQDKDGYTPLHRCALMGNEDLCRLLFEHNADVNIQDNLGYSPLHWCAFKGNENLCRLLLEHNADVNIQDADGYTPLHLCAREGNENLCRLLLEHNADVNIQGEDGDTTLHWCVRKGKENLCRLLLEHNADVNIQGRGGKTPLHWCASKGNENLCRLLLEHNADVNMKDYSGYTPLQLSVRDHYMFSGKIIDLLVTYGAQNIDIRDAEGRTLLQMAVKWGNALAVKKLVDHGADVSVVKANKTDARRLERLENEAKKLEQRLKHEMVTKQNIQPVSLPLTALKNSQSLIPNQRKY